MSARTSTSPEPDPRSWRVQPGDEHSPVILHAPHASRDIPAEVRKGIRLDDRELSRELDRMTDSDTDRIAEQAAVQAVRRGAARPWVFVNRLSRLVVDPERFPDDREQLSAKGMGAVYTRTSQGLPLRWDDPHDRQGPGDRQALVGRYFTPYAQAMTDLVDERLHATGRALILDVHSYPVEPQPYELHAQARRPEVCLGVDAVHTPGWLVDAARRAFASWETAVNEPFVGCYVPLAHYGRDARVRSLMIEIRRDTYQSRNDGIATLASHLGALIATTGAGNPDPPAIGRPPSR